jgi:hypothetical protein
VATSRGEAAAAAMCVPVCVYVWCVCVRRGVYVCGVYVICMSVVCVYVICRSVCGLCGEVCMWCACVCM